jgi:hypothetical protein
MIGWAPVNNHHWMDATIVGPVFALQYRMSGCLYAGEQMLPVGHLTYVYDGRSGDLT